jgi:ATP-dependent helicase/nuclease subunit A
VTQAHDQLIPPFNPWASYLVEASAGSGKTWQLSRRFLALVIAGADPTTILTVTFTRKAAAEMRERIIRDAVRLGEGHPEFVGFVDSIREWQKIFCPEPSRILTSAEASQLILGQTQALKITTIDALFIQWTQQFPLETALAAEGPNNEVIRLQSPWQLLSTLESERLEQQAWQQVLAQSFKNDQHRDIMKAISLNAPNGSIKQLSRAIEPITQSDTFLWSVSLATQQNPARFYDCPEEVPGDAEFIEQHMDLFQDVINLVTNEDKRRRGMESLARRDFAGLIANQIVTSKKDALSGTTFRAAKARENVSFQQLSVALQAWDGDARLAQLNLTARLLWGLYQARTVELHRLKAEAAVGSFSDAVKGVSLLATDDKAIGARVMAWGRVRHLMLDEFQDTSQLQWMIFERIARDLLSGTTASSPGSSVFIVGDKKQSIYRFREADPKTMDMAKRALTPFGLRPTHMSESYRSSSLVLDFVNAVFSDLSLMEEFPEHRPAPVLGLKNPDRLHYGSMTIYPEAFDPNDETAVSRSYECQAAQIANHIKMATSGALGLKVFDEKRNSWRSPIYSDFVILYPKKTHAHLIEDALRAASIPCQKEERHGFFERPEIVDLRALVTWLAWPADTVALCTLLRSPVCQLTDADLQGMLAAGADQLMSQLELSHPKVHSFLHSLRRRQSEESLVATIGYLLTDCHLASRYEKAFGPIEGPLAYANILKWFDMVRAQASDAAIDAQSWILAMDDASEEDETGNAALAANAVSLMTIHKSKGLEFPCVVVCDLSSDWHRPETGWLRDTRPGREGLWYIGTAATRPKHSPLFNERLNQSEIESREEKARLLYVALTRASTHLILTGARTKGPETDSFYHRLSEAASKLVDVSTQKLDHDGLLYLRGQPGFDDQTMTLESPQENLEIPTPVSETYRPPLLILTPSRSLAAAVDGTSLDVAATHEDQHGLTVDGQALSSEVGNAYGTLVHKLIENHILREHWSDQRYIRLLAQAIINAKSDELLTLLKTAKEEAHQVLVSQPWLQFLKTACHVYSELPITAIDGHHLINAKVDLILRHEDQSLSVIDFKTIPIKRRDGLAAPIHDQDLKALSVQLGYVEQVKRYCELASKAMGATSVHGFVLFTKLQRFVPVCDVLQPEI